MRKISLLLVAILFATIGTIAQTPNQFKYQAVLRNGSGIVLVNQVKTVVIEILKSNLTTSVFKESHTVTTNAQGLINLNIGSVADLNKIDWTADEYFIQITVDGIIMGTSQLLSVPYSLNAKNAENYSGKIKKSQISDFGSYLTEETDPVFSSSVANGITSTNISKWNAAYSWGNHAIAGYLTNYTETDPVFSSSVANGITATNISKWNAAYGWGNHATAGYLTGYTETDPVFSSSAAKGITATNISKWDAAYSWGNHATAGYLTGYTETDPVFSSSVAKGISSTNISKWDAAFNWGNHATAGYLISYTETDPVFSSSAAKGISATNISKWDAAYSWGNHAGLYRPLSYVPTWTEITSNPFNIISPTNNQLLKYNSTLSKWENWTPTYLTTEVDGSVTNEIELPSQSGNNGKFLTTDGNSAIWSSINTGNPTGTVIYFASKNPPAGYLICDGSKVSRTEYIVLFSVIGVTYGVGDGITTFNLPDLRGEFVRGYDNERGVDAGRVFGSSQEDMFKEHRHQFSGGQTGMENDYWIQGRTVDYNGQTLFTGYSGGSETRPRNVALLPCIKY